MNNPIKWLKNRNARDTRNTPDGKEKPTGKGRAAVAASAALIVVAAGVLTAATAAGKTTSTGAAANLYKETKVQRGDIVVGVTESGSAAVQAVSAGFPSITIASASGTSSSSSTTKVSTTVEELFVKAGQKVQQGDPIARLNAESIADALDDYQMQLSKANITLQDAVINQRIKSINAESTLKENQSLSGTADLQYQVTLKQIANTLANSQLTLAELEDKIADYEELLDDEIEDQYDLDSLESEWDTAQSRLEAFEKSWTIGSSMTEAEYTATHTTYEKAVSEAKSAYQSAKTNYESAVNDAKSQLDTLKNEYESKALQYDADKASQPLEELTAESKKEQNLSTAENADALYEVELAQLDNNVASEQLNVQTIQKKIDALQEYADSDGTLYAPCSGLVMSVNYDAGDSAEWDSAIMTIANSENVYVVVSIAQEDISTITLGMPADVSFSAYADSKFTGSVDSISVTPAMGGSSTVSYSVKIKLEGDASGIYEGMTGDVTFVTKEIDDVLLVSNRAVTAEDGRQYVLMYDESGAAARREVETGFSDGRNAEVISGLAEGDVVLIENKVATQTK